MPRIKVEAVILLSKVLPIVMVSPTNPLTPMLWLEVGSIVTVELVEIVVPELSPETSAACKSIAPDGELIAIVPVLESTPVPLVCTVTDEPLRLPPRAMPLFSPDAINWSGPPAEEIDLVVVIALAPAAESFRVKPPLPAVEAPLLVRASKSLRTVCPLPL